MAKVFGPAEIAAWGRALKERLPREFADEDIPGMPQVESMVAIVLNVGIGFRMRTRDDAEFDFLLNPVAARALAAGILKNGQEAGWLDERGEVTAPPRMLNH